MRALLAALAALAFLPLPAAAQPADCDWPAYGHDPGHSFATSCSTVRAGTLPVLKWFVPTPDSTTASPAVVDGTVYVGSWDGTFYAIDAESGDVRWTYQIADAHGTAFGRIVSSAAVDTLDGVPVVLFGGGATLHALDPATGRLLAAVDVDPRPSPPPPDQDEAQVEIESSPTVAHLPTGDRVFVGMDVHNRAGVGRTGLLAFALEPNDAPTPPYRFRLLWKFDPERGRVLTSLKDLDGSPGWGCGGVWSSPALYGGLVVFGTANCEHPQESVAAGEVGREAIFAVDAETGAERWRFTPRGPNRLDDDFGASPNVLLGGLVGEGGKDGLYYALRADGSLAWSSHPAQSGHVQNDFAIGGIIGTPAVGPDTIYVTSAFATPIAGPLDSEDPGLDASLAEDPQRLFSLAAISVNDGRVLWRSPLSRQSYGAPVYTNGVLLVPSTFDLSLKAFDAATGLALWTVPLPGAPSSAPVVAGDSIYIGVGTRETDLEFKAFGNQIGDTFQSLLGAHPLSRLSGVAAFRVAP